MKNCKTFCETQTVNPLKEIIQPPPTPIPPDKILLRLWNKNFLRELCRSMQTFAFKVLQECSSWASRNGADVFSDTKQTHVCWKICNVRKVFGSVLGAYYFQCQVS